MGKYILWTRNGVDRLISIDAIQFAAYHHDTGEISIYFDGDETSVIVDKDHGKQIWQELINCLEPFDIENSHIYTFNLNSVTVGE